MKDYKKPKMVEKKWGKEYWIVNGGLYCYKILKLKKNRRCSVHMHKIKHETFVIDSGKVLMQYDNKYYIMKKGDVIVIEPCKYHRFWGLKNSKIIEISTHHIDSDSYRKEPSGKFDQEDLKKFISRQ